MDTITSPAPTRPPFGPATGLRPVATPSRGSRHRFRQVGTFAAIGVVSTAAYVALFALLRPLVSAELANVSALVATAMGNTAANRRFTFSVRGGTGLARDHAAGLLALSVALAITSASLAVLSRVAPGAPHAVEIVVLVAANVVATIVRFLLLRLALDRGDPRGPRAAHAGPPAAGRLLERTVR